MAAADTDFFGSSYINMNPAAAEQERLAANKQQQFDNNAKTVDQLNNLSDWPTSPTSSAANSTANTGAGVSNSKSYTALPGWDQGKLNDPNKHDPKYDWARTIADVGGFGAGSRNNLQPFVDAYNQKYGGGAKVTGDDTVDFGDGYGPIDVLTSGGQAWWNPTTGGGAGTASYNPGVNPYAGMNFNPQMSYAYKPAGQGFGSYANTGGLQGLTAGPNGSPW